MNRVQLRHQSQSAEGVDIAPCSHDTVCTAQHSAIEMYPSWGSITTCSNEVLYPESIFAHSEHAWIAVNNSLVTSNVCKALVLMFPENFLVICSGLCSAMQITVSFELRN